LKTEQNGMIERFFRSLKEECTRLHSFETFDEAKRAITTWIRFFNEERSHRTPRLPEPTRVLGSTT